MTLKRRIWTHPPFVASSGSYLFSFEVNTTFSDCVRKKGRQRQKDKRKRKKYFRIATTNFDARWSCIFYHFYIQSRQLWIMITFIFKRLDWHYFWNLTLLHYYMVTYKQIHTLISCNLHSFLDCTKKEKKMHVTCFYLFIFNEFFSWFLGFNSVCFNNFLDAIFFVISSS